MIFRSLARAGALAALVILSACSDDAAPEEQSSDPAEFAAQSIDAEANATTSTTEQQPLNPTDIPGEPINKFELSLDDCFELIEDLNDGRPVTITTRLPCDDPHGYQIFHELLYPAEHPAVYPGEAIVREFALASCYRAFEGWVGQEYELSALDIDVIIPTQENFEDNAARYRGIHCWVERLDGEPMVGSARNSAW